MATVPLTLFARFAVATAVTVWSNWDTISGLFDRHVEAPDNPIYGYHCQHVFEMKDSSGTFSTRERGLFGIHYVNTTGGDLDVTWIAADYAAVESAVQTFWTTHGAKISADIRLVEHRWYPFGPGVIPPTPPSRVTTLGTPIVGTGGVSGAHQLASTVTLRTPLRRHWGRFYMPFTSPGVGTGGQISTANVDAIAADARTMFTSPQSSQGIVPVVWDRARKVALGVTAIEVDSNVDIIRRRRPRSTAYKRIYTS